jgi:acetyl esterase/lipase
VEMDASEVRRGRRMRSENRLRSIALFALVVSLTCVAVPTPRPARVQVAFTADRASLQPGECTTLRWDVVGGFGVALDGEVVERTGQRQVCPEESRDYSLRVDTGETIDIREVAISVAGGVIVHRDVAYASYEVDGVAHDLLLDLYLPAQDGAKPIPLLIFIHGGGWFEGSKATCPGQTFVSRGYAMACIDYRLANRCSAELVFPAQIHDVKAAVRWLRWHAGEYSLDPDRFGAMGDSSGGHLAALLGVSHGVESLAGEGQPGVSDAVQAVCDWFGPVDVTRPPPAIVFEDDPCTTSFTYLNETYGGEKTQYFYWTRAWGLFLGGSLVDPGVLDRAVQASPLSYIDAADPPFLIIHGERDGMVPIEQSELLAAALQDEGVDVVFVRLPETGHAYGGPGEEVAPEFLDPTLAFFDAHLGDK